VIVEAKNTASVDHSQLGVNAELALRKRGRIVYALPQKEEEEETSQTKALEEAFKKLPEAARLPPLQFIHLPLQQGFASSYYSGGHGGLAHVPTAKRRDEINNRDLDGEGDDFQEYY
jgi:hypothetical protein